MKTCVVCKGIGKLPLPRLYKHKDQKEQARMMAETLREAGYSYRQIMRFLDYKSPQSIQQILKKHG